MRSMKQLIEQLEEQERLVALEEGARPAAVRRLALNCMSDGDVLSLEDSEAAALERFQERCSAFDACRNEAEARALYAEIFPARVIFDNDEQKSFRVFGREVEAPA